MDFPRYQCKRAHFSKAISGEVISLYKVSLPILFNVPNYDRTVSCRNFFELGIVVRIAKRVMKGKRATLKVVQQPIPLDQFGLVPTALLQKDIPRHILSNELGSH